MTSFRLGIADIGLATPIGIGKRAVGDALFRERRTGLVPRSDLVRGRTFVAGSVTTELPPIPTHLSHLSCRNNRMALAALSEMRVNIDSAIRRYGRSRIAVVVGTSTSGIADGEAAFAAGGVDGQWPKAFHYRQQETGCLGEFIAQALDLAGPAYTISTACSSSGKVFASARRLILAGLADAALVGGADTLCRLATSGFASLEALAPSQCNPFSRNRCGINVGEGAAFFLLVPEAADVDLAGVGETSDAHHVSAPDPTGDGARRAMLAALDDGGHSPDDVAYLNLHGTGTKLNDAMESIAVDAVFGTHVPVSSTKAMTGHMLGAAAAGEAALLWLTLNPTHNPDGLLPPHLWDGERDPTLPPLTFVSGHEPLIRHNRGAAALSNSFAFGGSNIALLLAQRSHE